MSHRTDPFHVLIVGGGISGLATAWYVEREAKARGLTLTCTVLETTDRVGGKVLTETVSTEAGDFVLEGGPDSFLAVQKPWGVQLATELGLSSRLVGTNEKERRVYVICRGRPIPLPEGIFLLAPTKLRPFVFSRLISPRGKLRMALDLVIPRRTGNDDETLGDFVVRRFGSEALDKIAEPLLSGIYSAEVGRQSLLATFPRFREMEQNHGSLIRAVRAGGRRRAGSGGRPSFGREASLGRERQPTEEPAWELDGDPAGNQGGPAAERPSSVFVSFKRGTYELIEGLVDKLDVRIECKSEVVGIGRGGDRVDGISTEAGSRGLGSDVRGSDSDLRRLGRYLVKVARRGADGLSVWIETVEADAVVLATPAYVAAALLERLSPAAAKALRSIRYVSTGTISLAYREDASWASVHDRLHSVGILVPASERRPINAITWSSVKFPGRAPEGHSLLRVFFGGSRSPRSMELDDAELLEVVQEQLREIMGISGAPLLHHVHRWEQGNPQYDVGHLSLVAAVESTLPPRVWVTGSPYRGIGLPDCARQAVETAEKVVEELGRGGGRPCT